MLANKLMNEFGNFNINRSTPRKSTADDYNTLSGGFNHNHNYNNNNNYNTSSYHHHYNNYKNKIGRKSTYDIEHYVTGNNNHRHQHHPHFHPRGYNSNDQNIPRFKMMRSTASTNYYNFIPKEGKDSNNNYNYNSNDPKSPSTSSEFNININSNGGKKNNENYEILTVTIKVAEDSYKTINLHKFDDYYITAKDFCEKNHLPSGLIKPLAVKLSLAISSINQVFNMKLSNEDVVYLNRIQNFWKISSKGDNEDVDDEYERKSHLSDYTCDSSDSDEDDINAFIPNKDKEIYHHLSKSFS
jgi:hypothetical protein